MSEFIVRYAEPQDLPVLRQLLPGMFSVAPPVTFMAAVRLADGQVLGGVGVHTAQTTAGPMGGRFAVVVAPAFRRRKVGTALLHSVFGLAAHDGIDQLTTAGVIHQDEVPANAFCRKHGFQIVQRNVTFTARIDNILAVLDPLLRRADNAQSVVAFAAREPAAAADAATKVCGGTAAAIEAKIRDGWYDPDCSLIAEAGGRPVGVILARTRISGDPADSCFCEMRAVAPDHRGGLTNVRLITESARRAKAKGLAVAVFEADEDLHRDTWKLAGRVRAARHHERYVYALNRPTFVAKWDAWIAAATRDRVPLHG